MEEGTDDNVVSRRVARQGKTEERRARPLLVVVLPMVAAIRAIMVIPILATQVAALALLAFGTLETWHFALDLLEQGGGEHNVVLYRVIEIIDLFLVVTVAEVVSLGLFQLYFGSEPSLPAWLKIETLEDLKSKLIGVTVTVLAVFFLGRALVWTGGQDIGIIGISVAAIVAALTWFLSKIDRR